MWTSTFLSLESYLPASKRSWCREFVKMKIRNLQSLLVCSIILLRVSSTEDDWIFVWRSRLASQILILFLPFTFVHCRWVNRLFCSGTPPIQFFWIRWRWWRIWIWKKTFPDILCVPNAWVAFSAARRYERMSQHPIRYWMKWEYTARLLTWEVPLRIDSASWISLSWSSTNLRLAIVSKVELWNFFNSSISSILFMMSST